MVTEPKGLQISGEVMEDLCWFDRANNKICYPQLAGVFLDMNMTAIISSEFAAWEQFRRDLGLGIHSGTDIPAPKRTPIYWDASNGFAIASGVAFGTGFGNRLVVLVTDHEGVQWLIGIAHMDDRPIPTVSKPVKRGNLVGYVGNSGTSTGPHMHIWIGRALDFDRTPGEEEGVVGEYAEFWRSPRDNDGRVTRLHDIRDFLVSDESLRPKFGPLFLPLPIVDGVHLVSIQRDVEIGVLEGNLHSYGISSMVTWDKGEIQQFHVGAPEFVWDDLLNEFPDGIVDEGTLTLLVKR